MCLTAKKETYPINKQNLIRPLFLPVPTCSPTMMKVLPVPEAEPPASMEAKVKVRTTGKDGGGGEGGRGVDFLFQNECVNLFIQKCVYHK